MSCFSFSLSAASKIDKAKYIKMKRLILLLLCLLSPSLQANIEQGITAFEQHNFSLAKKILSQQSDEDYKKFFYLALIASKNGDLDEAEEYINKTIDLNPLDANVQFTYAEIMAKQAEEASLFTMASYVKKVKKSFMMAVELAPENIEYRRALIKFHTNAPGMLGGDINEALKHAQALKKVDTLSGTGALIHVLGKMGNDEKFTEELNFALLNFVDEPELYYQLGLYYQEQENFNEAFVNFRKAAHMVTTSDKQRNARYRALFQIGRTSLLSNSSYDEGVKAMTQYFQEAVITSSMPSKSWAKYRLANLIEAQGDQSQARQLYKELIQDSANKDIQKKAKKRMKKLS